VRTQAITVSCAGLARAPSHDDLHAPPHDSPDTGRGAWTEPEAGLTTMTTGMLARLLARAGRRCSGGVPGQLSATAGWVR